MKCHFAAMVECAYRVPIFCTAYTCNAIVDGSINTCSFVLHNKHPWVLKAFLKGGCIGLQYEGTFDVDVIGKGLVCDDKTIRIGVCSTKNKMCHLTGQDTDNINFLVTCHLTCGPINYLPSSSLM